MTKEIRWWKFWEFIIITFRSQWSSLIFWRKMNWRDFTFIQFEIEFADYAERFTLDFWLLGLGFGFAWHESCRKKRKQDLENFMKEIGIN